MSTNFQHKRIHKIAWLSPDQNTAGHIDHIIINANKRWVIEDVRSMRGPNINSDNFLIKAVIKQKLSVIYKKKLKPALKWNKIILQNPSNLKEYRSLLHNEFINLVPKQEINDEWEQIETAIADAARNVIQTQGKLPRSEWWDDECKKIIQEKNEVRIKWLHLKTIISWNTYIERRKQANKICTKKWLSNKITQIEENHRKNETIKFFDGIWNYIQEVTLPVICKDAEGNVISQSNLILERWKNYFCKILNISESIDIHTIIWECTNNQPQIPLPSYNEICFIINNLKLNEAAGSDKIPPLMLKHGGRTLEQKLYKLTLMIWNNEQVPQQWNEGIICPIYKKGDGFNCNNYRPITLLHIAYKIFAILLNKRLMEKIENKLENNQMGFRPNRSNIDNILL